MARRCFLTGKGPRTSKSVSHSHRRTNRKLKPNLQKVTIMVGNNKRKVKVSAKMIKKGATIGLRISKKAFRRAKRSTKGLNGVKKD